MHYCRLGPGCDVTAWRGFGSNYYIKFGSALANDPSPGHLHTESLDIFAETLAALNRAGFRVPRSAFERIDAEIRARDAAIAAEKARQADLFAGAK